MPSISRTNIMVKSATSSTTLICLTATIVFFGLLIESHAVFLPKRLNLSAKEKIIDPARKRPFCNAFTGCGRKRSNLPALTEQGDVIDESLGSLLELSAEPAVEDLSRQIMSEAKLWEAIQEANMELSRRRQQQQQQNNGNSFERINQHHHRDIEDDDDDDVAPVAAQSATASCALPPCYI